MNRRILFLGGAFLSAVLFFSFGMMILQQKGLAQQEKQRAYSKKALSVANTLTKRLSTVLTQAGEYTNSAAMGEFFTSQRISLFDFPENFRDSVKRIRIADSSGLILFSTSGTLDRDSHLSSELLSLASGAVNRFVVFTPDQDTFAAVTRYDNPTTLQMGTQGYMLFEFSASSILQGLPSISPIVRVENGKPLLILNNAPDTSFQNIVAFDLNKPSQSGSLTGVHLSMPYLGNMVFYMGSIFYFPPILSILTLIFCLLMVFMLYLYTKSQSSQSSIPEDKVREMKSLISDINQGKTYSQQQAFNAVESGSRFGSLSADDISEYSPSQANSSETPSFTFGLLDEDPVHDNPTEWDDSAMEDIAFDDVPSNTFANDEDSSLMEEETSAEDSDFESFLESDEETDLGVDEAVSSLLTNDEDSSLMEDEELTKEAVDFSSFLEQDEDTDEANSELLADDEVEVAEPTEVGEASVGDLAELLNPDDLDEDFSRDEVLPSPLELYNAHVKELAEEYGISRKAVAENREGLFLIDDTSIFGSSFQIAVEDPIFKEVLSKGRVLSLDGNLEESMYIAGLINPDILETLSDLFIVPIVDKEQRVSHVVVLGRDKGSSPLSVEEHKNLFSYQ